MRKVIDNNRVGLFDLCSMGIDPGSEADRKLKYEKRMWGEIWKKKEKDK